MPAYSQQDFLDLLSRLFPVDWLGPLESPGPGYELLQASAAVGARLSLAVSRVEADAYLSSATGGAYAAGEVELSRPAAHPDGITVTVLAGTTVRASRGGQRYATLEDATFGPADVGPLTVPVRAVARGYEWDVPGEVTAAGGVVLPGEVDSPDVLVEAPDAGDLTIRVRQVLPTSGGVDAALDLHGRDRGVPRGAGEGDAGYRGRLRALPDNVSPDAVERALQQLLLPYGGGYDFIETWGVAYQTCWDGPEAPVPGSAYDPTCFVFDDPRPPVPFRGRWLDLDDMRGAFLVLLPRFPPLTDSGMAYGPDPASPPLEADAAALANPLGRRALCAWDAPASAEGFGYLLGAWDGFDSEARRVYREVYETLQRIKAAGTSATVELRGE